MECARLSLAPERQEKLNGFVQPWKKFRKSVHATFPTVTLYWGSKGWIPKSPMQLSIEERNCWETFCVSRLVEQYVLARRDKRFLILFSEGLTREAGHHFRCMKHFTKLWNTYGDALFTLENFINSYMSKKSKHQEYPACLLFICAATS